MSSADDHGVAAGLQRLQLPLHQQRPHIGDALLERRVDATQHHRHHVGQCTASAVSSMIRRHPDHARQPLQALAQRPLPVRRRCGPWSTTRACALSASSRSRSSPSKPFITERITISAATPSATPSERHPGDQRDEELVLARAHVAQADETEAAAETSTTAIKAQSPQAELRHRIAFCRAVCAAYARERADPGAVALRWRALEYFWPIRSTDTAKVGVMTDRKITEHGIALRRRCGGPAGGAVQRA